MATAREYRLPQITGYQSLILTEGPVSKPKENEVLLKVHAVSLQYRDLVISTGHYPLKTGQNLVPGSDAACEIVELGTQVKGWKKGDRVCPNFNIGHLFGDITPEAADTGLGGQIDGVLREYVALPAECLVRIPEHLSWEEASTLPCAAVTAYNALTGLKQLKGGDKVLVLGSGGVSIFALQIAKASGAEVIVTTSSEAKAKKVKELGATHVINYNAHPEWDEEVLRLTGGVGVDHTIEVGGPGTIEKSFNSTRMGGYIHAIGFLAALGGEINAAMKTLQKAICLRGVLIGSRAQFEDMNKLFSVCKIRPVVDKVFSFEDAKQAYAYLESQAHVGKVVIKVSKD